MTKLEKILAKRILFLDGATGTNLLNKGLAPGQSPSWLNLTHPQAVYGLHKAYIDAGSDIILTNTFSANPLNFPTRRLKNVINEGIRLARMAAKNRAIIFGDVGPLGILIRPYGDMEFAEATKIYQEIFKIFHFSGIKRFFCETFSSIIEAKAAYFAARSFSKNIIMSFSLQENGRTVMGETPESIAVVVDALGAEGLGINCTLPDVAIDAISKMARLTNLPLVIKPNAGKIEIVNNQLHHTISDFKMAKYFHRFVRAGANIIGGCCGTSPDYIKIISKNSSRPSRKKLKRKFILASPSLTLELGKDSLCVVGERLNPSGCKRIKEGLLHKDFPVYAREAIRQEKAGAQALDVNAFMIDLDEKETLKKAVYEVIKHSELPLFIDTQDFDAAEAVLAFYPGIGVYNSIPARKKELCKWLPMLKRYGFRAVISLTGKKIPESYAERMENVNRALAIARRIGFPKEDLIFDPLVFSAATQQLQIKHTLRTVASLKRKGLKTILGISNVSYGLPKRHILNAVFTTAAIDNGVTFLILNPLNELVMNSVNAARGLFRGDISYATGAQHLESRPNNLTDAIIYGDERLSVAFARKLLNSKISPQVLIDNYISKAFQIVGEYYEGGKFFIPDLLRSAEASKAVLAIIKPYLPKEKSNRKKIILATVKGDIHDIGKNIVGMMFESAGYEVIDLGKDVSAKKIINAVKKYKPDVIGLSALLTTTMSQMADIIKSLKKEKIRTRVIIGGPNVSDVYAKKIGALAAAKDVLDGLNILKNI